MNDDDDSHNDGDDGDDDDDNDDNGDGDGDGRQFSPGQRVKFVTLWKIRWLPSSRDQRAHYVEPAETSTFLGQNSTSEQGVLFTYFYIQFWYHDHVLLINAMICNLNHPECYFGKKGMALTGFNALMEKLVFKGFQHKESIIGCSNAFLIKQMKVL